MHIILRFEFFHDILLALAQLGMILVRRVRLGLSCIQFPENTSLLTPFLHLHIS